MSVLITGGAGFIGSHVADKAIEAGHSIAVVDNLSTGNRANVNRRARFYRLDICSPRLEGIFKKEKPEVVIHHAAQINVRHSVKEPAFDAKVNIIGSLNILECARKTGVRKVIYASSGGARYGEPEYLPCDELHPVSPICHYGVSKHTVEHYLYLYRHLYGLDYTILAYANVYGPRQDPKGEAGVVSIFISRLASGEQAVIFGSGRQTRDFVYVGDVADANILAMRKRTRSRYFNIGTNCETSVNQIYREIASAMKSGLKPIHAPSVPGEIRRIRLDIRPAARELGWKPMTGLREGVGKTVAWYIDAHKNGMRAGGRR
ncbi:UDP-glucose 4-epimerase [Candidatus Woesearchaeota archaeon CG08_land_8_20_14_0_20_47_9]|nr:MAG: UDP-glucose 4-epimerase [Candidatus Woesearchaeota archaeon CG1_02_47_18]PIO03680.1 MAG: UDP-glucose 4-epimerase [Candidatus Woesearchaeota archaeon CG08_land_8_20_14_0_20_47_9]HII30059.1 NAD-dependent epimerase/dehydratase family protein [Candidatus Woesearchaeota archaeon]